MEIDVPASWQDAAEAIERNGWRKILVLGGVDQGKSVFCRFLAHRLLQHGARVAVIDADVGQKDIGPPACITLGYPDVSSPLAQTKPEVFYFVGAVTPVGHFLPMVIGVRLLVDQAIASFVIINTTGLIHKIGRVLKDYKIEAVQPNVLVGIQSSSELKTLFRSHRNRKNLQLQPSPRAKPKTLEQRRSARENSFADYFANAGEVRLNFRKLIFQRTLLFNGRPIGDRRFTYCEQTSEGMIGISADSEGKGDNVKLIRSGSEENLLCGLVDSGGRGQGLAIIKRIHFKDNSIALITPVLREKIEVVQTGDLYVTPAGVELDRKRPGWF
jgi:polynucleotide 5'-hydroxyl-kinase GRC3/NOL9